MDLRQRLAHLDKLTRKPAAASARQVGPRVRRNVDTDAVVRELGLACEETSGGRVWTRELIDPVASLSSPLPDLSGLFTRSPRLQPALPEVLLLDTETTGLSGGTGTLVFQVGASWWANGALHTRQYFLPDPGGESAMLAALGELATRFKVIVTFNGASFDLPLVRTRALLNRLDDPFAGLVSWDLLVPARRLWGTRLPDCRQQTIEGAICGLPRGADDLDGAYVPQAWFDFLVTGLPGLLPRVLSHNHGDMLGMAHIFRRVCEVGSRLAHPDEDAASSGNVAGTWEEQWSDRPGWWALGRTYERRLDRSAAAACFAKAWRHPWGQVSGAANRSRFQRDAVRNLKRCQRWDLVEKIILNGLALANETGNEKMARSWHREAAILYEHRLKDLRRAFHHAVLAADEHRTGRLKFRLDPTADGKIEEATR